MTDHARDARLPELLRELADNEHGKQFADMSEDMRRQRLRDFADRIESDLDRQPAPSQPADAVRERHIEVLRAIGSAFDRIPAPCDERGAIEAAIAALAQPAAVGAAASDARIAAMFRKLGFDGIEELPGWGWNYSRTTCSVEPMIANGVLLEHFDAWAGYTHPPRDVGDGFVVMPDGLRDRVESAIQRIVDGHAPRRVPADPTDVDLVLAEVLALVDGKWPPFWLTAAPGAGGAT